MPALPKATFFSGPDELRAWFEEHGTQRDELHVGIYKKATGKQVLSWAQAVDEALCFGWIDSRGRRIDEERHMVRFTPRRKGSNWSERNIGRVEALEAQGRMRPAGRAAFEGRVVRKSG